MSAGPTDPANGDPRAALAEDLAGNAQELESACDMEALESAMRRRANLLHAIKADPEAAGRSLAAGESAIARLRAFRDRAVEEIEQAGKLRDHLRRQISTPPRIVDTVG
ncbi:MAG: hypothetical protein ABI823_00305 [Bryobacteraceae bacterium]